MALTRVTSDGITDGSILNADLHTSANIAGSKIADGSITGAKLANIISLSDSQQLRLGDSNDLIIRHDGSNSIIQENGTGNLVLKTNGTSVAITTGSGGQIAEFNNNSTCVLRHQTNERISTSSTGVSVTGSITGVVSAANTNLLHYTANMGTNNNRTFIIKAPATDSTAQPFSFNTANAFEFNVDSARTLFIHESGRIDLHHDGSTDAKLSTSSTGISVTGNIAVSGTVDGVDIATRDTLFGGLTSSSGVLTDGVTATTQSAGNNTTRVATTAFVSTAISNLVDSSPSALNTLNELAAALGDDANFSTTVTNSIATKLALSGGTVTGVLALTSSSQYPLNINSSDNGKIVLQGSNAPYIRFREGTTDKAFIQWNNDGYLRLHNEEDSSQILLKDDITFSLDGGNTNYKMWHGGNDGAGSGLDADTVDGVQGSSFLRSDAGDEATGDITFSGGAGAIRIAADSDIRFSSGTWTGNTAGKIQHHNNILYFQGGSGGFAFLDDGGTGRWKIDANGHLQPNTDGDYDIGTSSIRVRNGYFDTLYGDGSNLTGVTSTTINSNADNRVITGSGTANTLNAESGLLWDSVTLTCSGSTNQKIILQGATHPYIHFYEGTTGKAFIQWHADGYLRIKNDEDDATIRLKDNIEFSPNDSDYYKMWHANNDGSGSGLDADTVDGIQGSSFIRSDTADTASGDITFSGGAGAVTLTAGSDIRMTSGTWTGEHAGKIQYHSNKMYIQGGSNGHQLRDNSGGTTFEINPSGTCAGVGLTLGQTVQHNADATFNGGAGAATIATHSDIRFNAGNWTGEASYKIQAHSGRMYIQAPHVIFRDDGGANRWNIDSSGHFIPENNNTYDIGSSSKRIRNIYTNDLNLSNEGGSNDVDGTWGSYTIQEGAEELFLVNRRNGKKYKFNLTEVS